MSNSTPPSEAFQVTYPGVHLGPNGVIGPFVVLGEPPRGARPGELETLLGADAVIRSHTVIYAGNVIGDRFQTGHGVRIREHNRIGDDVSIGTNSVVEHHVAIGDGVRIHTGAFVPEATILEAEVWVGPAVVMTNARHPVCPEAKRCLVGPRIRRGAKIGAGAVLLPGVEIGAMALIGAGAVVVHDVPPRAVVVGNPARVIKTIDDIRCLAGLLAAPYPSI
jgi:acetyltransferase-like isoleucine patch superfamily enzyme